MLGKGKVRGCFSSFSFDYLVHIGNIKIAARTVQSCLIFIRTIARKSLVLSY